jgi:hypothetical protein
LLFSPRNSIVNHEMEIASSIPDSETTPYCGGASFSAEYKLLTDRVMQLEEASWNKLPRDNAWAG